VQVLRTVIANADRRNKSAFLHFEKPAKEDLKPNALNLDLNKLMQNVDAEFFDYGTFVAAFETDPRIKTMVKNFSKDGIEVKTKNQIDDAPQDGDEGNDAVSQMAKRATDVGAEL